MSKIDLFTSQTNTFGGLQKSFADSNYVIFGVPFDVTSTYRTGARFGPSAIRQASANIETYSIRAEVDLEDIKLHDAGDINISTDPTETVDICSQVVKEIFQAGKIPVAIGGEHTITLGIIKGFDQKTKETAVVSFDAHLDLREEFLGLKLSHTTFMQLISKTVRPAKIFEVGTRSVCKEELKFAKKSGVQFITTQKIRSEGPNTIASELKEQLASFENIYISVDMDVVDPAFAPAVQNPEADGISTGDLLDIVCNICDKRVIGMDILEIAPIYDNGISAIAAAKVIFEMLCHLEKSKRKK